MYRIEPMSGSYADTISRWAYSGEYALYSFEPDDETIAELMSDEYFSCVDGEGHLVGYFCFGDSAKIPAVEARAYGAEMLDIGLGLQPELCGQGLGEAFMRAGIVYAEQNFHVKALRLTVAAFNNRAIKVYERLGFQKIGEVTHRVSGENFFLMVR